MKLITRILLAFIFLGTISQTYAQQRPFFNTNKDLLIAQFDSKPDPDDIHAQAALGSMLAHSDLAGVNAYGVAGAYGRQGGQFIDSDQLFEMVFGSGNWTDADANRNASITRIANKVIPILNNGGKVWVQEAGQSNITRDWLIEVQKSVNNNVVKNNVIVVQHSEWNQNHADNTTNATAANPVILNFVRNNTSYFYIDDGNAPFGGFGDHGPWSTPEYRSRDQKWLNQALSSPNAKAKQLWTEAERVIAIRYPNGVPYDWSFMKNGGTDYSDCAENWWIFNIGDKADSVTKFWSRYVTNTSGSNPDPDPDPDCTDKTFEEKNGIVAVEAEDFVKQSKTENREWFVIGQATNTPTPDPDPSHAGSASGGKYLELLPDTRVTHGDPLTEGVNFTNTPGKAAVVDYKIKFNSPGKYFVWVRAYSTGTEDNGVHVGINGTWPASGARMQWCEGKNAWTWASKQRTNAQHCGVPELIFLNIPSAGVHTISFSMREDGFEIDKFILSKAYTTPTGAGPAPLLADCGGDTGGGSCSTNTQIANLRSTGSTETSITADWADVSGANTYELRAWPKGQFTGNINSPAATSFASGNASPVTISGLVKGTEYTLVLRAICSSGGTSQLSQINAATSGGAVADCSAAPTGLTQTGSTTTSATFTFNNTSSNTRSFEIRPYAPGTFTGNINVGALGYASAPAGSTSISIGNLQPGTSYDFVFRAICTGNPASPTAVVSGSTDGTSVPQTAVLSPIEDAFVQGSAGVNQNVLRVQQGFRTSYLKFDVSAINGPITSASLKLTVNDDSGNGNIQVLNAANNNWSESTINGSNAPGNGSALGNLNQSFNKQTAYTFNLSNMTVNGNFLSLVVTHTGGNDVSFKSSEAPSGTPELTVAFNSNRASNQVDKESLIATAFPNPANNQVFLSGLEKNSSISIIDMAGRSVVENVLSDQKNMTLDITKLEVGMYFIKIRGLKQKQTISFIKQ